MKHWGETGIHEMSNLIEILIKLCQMYTVGHRFTGSQYTRTPIYLEDKLPGTSIYRANSFPSNIPIYRGPTAYMRNMAGLTLWGDLPFSWVK